MIIVNDNVISLKTNKTKRMSDAMDAYLNSYVPLDVFYKAIRGKRPDPKGIILFIIPYVGNVVFLNNAVGILLRLFSTSYFWKKEKDFFVHIYTTKNDLYPSFCICKNGTYDRNGIVAHVFQFDNDMAGWGFPVEISNEDSGEIMDFMERTNYIGKF